MGIRRQVLPSKMQEQVAKALAVGTASVTVHARYLREAGVLTKQGRGLSAAVMGAKDCAALLLGIVASQGPAEAAARYGEFKGAFLEGTGGSGTVLRDLGFDERELSAVGVLERFIESVRDGTAAGVLARARVAEANAGAAFRLQFQLGHPASLRLDYRGTQASDVEWREFVNRGEDEGHPTELRTYRVISAAPVFSLGYALRT